MNRYRCKICRYVYDPLEGDPDGDIVRGTLFENLPDNRTCPVCGVNKTEFVEDNW